MCTYINAAVPPHADVDAIADAIARLNLGSGVSPGDPSSDPMFLSVLPQKFCHCGTPLGSVRRPQIVGDAAFAQQIERHRKRGWSDAKIRRWLEEMHRVQRRTEREYRELERSGFDEWAETWRRFLQGVVATGAASRIGLAVGEPDKNGKERPIRGEVTLRLEQLQGRELLEMEDDVLYWFTS
jgi:hypothetical protein